MSVGLPAEISVSTLAIDTQNTSTLYIGTGPDLGYVTTPVFKSTDGGESWNPASLGLPGNFVSSLTIDSQNSGTVYAVTGNGIFKTTDGGMSWSATNMGLPATYVSALTLDPQDSGTLYAGTLTGIFTSTDGAQSWRALNYPGLPAGVQQLSFDPRSPTTLYAVAGGAVFEFAFVPTSQPAPSVTGLTLNLSVVRLEGSYAVVFVGPNLTDKTYFDIRYRLPDSAVDRECRTGNKALLRGIRFLRRLFLETGRLPGSACTMTPMITAAHFCPCRYRCGSFYFKG